MESFLKKFFPGLLKRAAHANKDVYCIYNNQALTAFTSSLYAFGMVGTLVASRVTRRLGRQAIMLIGGSMFLVGALVNAAAANVAMLIVGRMLLGLGLGFSGQATPVYLAEVSPPRWRGGFISAFPLFISVGYLVANLINYGTSRIPEWGWRLSLGLAAVPAAVMVAGAAFIPDTPSSLVLRGKHDDARAALQRVRGKGVDIGAEFADILAAAEHARRNEEGAFWRILRREYRPYLVTAVAFPVFLNLTGVAVTAFFSPILFRTVGFESDAALMGAVILGVMNIGGILASGFAMDRYGRKLLFVIGGALMFTCQAYTDLLYTSHSLILDTGMVLTEMKKKILHAGDHGEHHRLSARQREQDGKVLRGDGADCDVRVLGELQLVLGRAVLDDPRRDLPGGGAVGRAGRGGGAQPGAQLPAGAVLPGDAVLLQVRRVPLLRVVAGGDDRLRRGARAGDQGRAARVHGPRLRAPLVLGQVRQGPEARRRVHLIVCVLWCILPVDYR
jgi:MFS family permease